MGKRVPSGVIINDIIRRKHSIILNIRVRWDSCGSVRRNSTESSFLSTSDSSDSDDETFVINYYLHFVKPFKNYRRMKP